MYVINSKGWYFDTMYSNYNERELFQDTWKDMLKVDILRKVPDENKQYVLGGAGCMWSCIGRYQNNAIDSLMYPRALAIQEALWDYKPGRSVGTDDLLRIERLGCILRRNGVLSGPLRSSDGCRLE